MSKAKEIIKNIKENGGLDMRFVERNAREEGMSTREYLKDWIKGCFECHGKTANTVADYFA
jgi:hypothetical protein